MDTISDHLSKTKPVQQGRLRVFLGLKTSDKVLVVGTEMTKQYQSLLSPCDLHTGALHAWQGYAQYNCLLFDVGRCTSKSLMKQELECADGLLTNGGILLLLTTNFITLRYLLSETNRDDNVSIFLPFPRGSGKPDEYFRIKSNMLADPHEYGKVICLLHLLGLYPFFHNNYFVIKSSVSIEGNGLFRKVSVSLSKHLGKRCCIQIERFDARMRGALIVFISEMKTGQRFIARIVTEHNTKFIVRKNQQFLKGLHSSSMITHDIKSRIPQVLGEVDWQGSAIFLEDWLQGVLAWKLINKRNSNIIFQEALNFLQTFNQITSRRTVLDGAMWGQLFAEDQKRFQKITVPEALQNKITVLLKVIKNNFYNEECTFVGSHGDFGYGNIILDPHSYQLTGVIDWDTGRTQELPGVDFFNLLIQQGRTLGLSLLDSATVVMEQLTSEPLPISWRNYLQPYASTSMATMFLFGVTLLRYMSRAAQYEKIFLKEQEDYFQILLSYEKITCI